MNRFPVSKAVAYLFIVFLLGAGTGGSLAWHFARQPRPGHGPNMDHIRQSMRDRFISRLQLTPSQVQEITPFMDSLDYHMRRNFNEITRLSDEAIANFHAEISPFLTQEQKEELERMSQERRRFTHPKSAPSCGLPPVPVSS